MKTSLTLSLALGLIVSAASRVSADDGQSGLVAVLDVARVFEQHNRFKSEMEAIKGEIQAFEQDFTARRQALQNEARVLQQGLIDKTITDAQAKNEEAGLARREAEMSIQANQKREEILEREAKLYFDTYNQVVAVVSQVCGEYNISLVIRHDSSEIDPADRASVIKGVNRGVVFQRNLDLTDLIIERVNAGAPRVGANPSSTAPRN